MEADCRMASGDDLNDPLGLGQKPRRRGLPFRPIFLTCAAVALIGGLVFLAARGDPFGGEPHAVAVIVEPGANHPAANKAASAATGAVQPDTAPNDVTGTIPNSSGDDSAASLEQRSGVKVVRSGGAAAPGALIIEVPKLLANRLAPAPDPRLVEKSRFGLLPRVGADGARPADVYARPWSATGSKANAPLVALIIGGVGLSDSATAQAIDGLPGQITLAFAPYGNDLKGKVAQAREAGHEVILQLPMEPIDYPQTNPGPHTLLSNASAEENTDSLDWLLARFTGYTGVANFLGAKFSETPEALKPVLGELNRRGLFYLDDGSTARSMALSLAQDLGLPAARVDVIVDGAAPGTAKQPITTTAMIDANLAKLETIARKNGTAIGMASDLPGTIEELARYAQLAEAHGIVLIPLSAAIGHPGRSGATADGQGGDGRTTPDP
jgi:uncharacterized protein